MEDLFGTLTTKINNHRKKVDNKYWETYLMPYYNDAKIAAGTKEEDKTKLDGKLPNALINKAGIGKEK